MQNLNTINDTEWIAFIEDLLCRDLEIVHCTVVPMTKMWIWCYTKKSIHNLQMMIDKCYLRNYLDRLFVKFSRISSIGEAEDVTSTPEYGIEFDVSCCDEDDGEYNLSKFYEVS